MCLPDRTGSRLPAKGFASRRAGSASAAGLAPSTLAPGDVGGKFKVVTTFGMSRQAPLYSRGNVRGPRADDRQRWRYEVAGNQWPLIRGERVALIADLENVTDLQWSTQSLCAAWTVRDVLAHMTTTAKMTPGRFFGKFAGSGFQFNAFNEKGVKEELGATPSDTLAAFKGVLDRTTGPPGPIDAMVAEAVIHSQDIRRPLGIAHTFPAEILTLVGDFVIRGNLLLGGKRRATGLTLHATDVDWTRGTGPEVQGPLASIILALTGRKAGLSDLSGDGLATLTGRL